MAEEKSPGEVQMVTPGEYFNVLKGKKQKINDGILEEIYNNCLILLEKYQRTNQVDAMKKLLFHLDVIEKERQVLAAGLDTFVYLSDVKAYVENVQDRVVKIIELERYEREIPDEIIDAYEKVKDIFSKFFIVFTDYTKEHVDKTKKERDPILFGMFQDKNVEATAERLYFIGDWEDEYCDLTLDRLVSEMKKVNPDVGEDTQVEFTLRDPKNLDELRAKLKALDDERRNGRMNNNLYVVNTNTNSTLPSATIITAGSIADEPKKEESNFFSKVRSFFNKRAKEEDERAR